jgi:hypothetical protein
LAAERNLPLAAVTNEQLRLNKSMRTNSSVRNIVCVLTVTNMAIVGIFEVVVDAFIVAVCTTGNYAQK